MVFEDVNLLFFAIPVALTAQFGTISFLLYRDMQHENDFVAMTRMRLARGRVANELHVLILGFIAQLMANLLFIGYVLTGQAAVGWLSLFVVAIGIQTNIYVLYRWWERL